jgi:small-conductance mechanosensitive channel
LPVPIGYVGFIAVATASMGRLGLNLENIALVAGALSVGIGFGLQSIVSNFVSGLILLAERPIRVGDAIVVKGEEGYVRKISVRATEIETYERASVIIPNSELITGVVKNWTHANTTGRIIVKVGVAYDSDPDEVRDILMACACDHPQLLQTPPPRVLLTGFGDSALEFELRCVVANVDYGLTVKSDLHFAILHRFRKAGIEIPFPQREVRVRGGEAPPAAG